MPCYYVELFTPKKSWIDLPLEKRLAFLASARAAKNIFTNLGVSILYLGKCDVAVPQASRHSFMVIWRFEDDKVRYELIDSLGNAGWYDYFDHSNAVSLVGDDSSVDDHLQRLMDWPESA